MVSGCNFNVVSLRLYLGSGREGHFYPDPTENMYDRYGWVNSDSYQTVQYIVLHLIVIGDAVISVEIMILNRQTYDISQCYLVH